jgi:hypothetical protein
MAFVTHLDASAELNRRDSERRLVNTVFAAWSGRGAPFTVIVHDISETGFRAEFASELHVGDEVRLRLGGAGYVPATVVWRDGWDHGCRFLTPILPDEVQEAMKTLTPVVGAAEPDTTDGANPDGGLFGPGARGRKNRRIALLIVGLFVVVELYFLGKMLV